MDLINSLCRAIFTPLMTPLMGLPPVVSLCLVSFILGVLAMLVFRYTSNQSGLSRAGDRTRANLLAMRLYAHDNWEQFRAIFGLFWASILRVWNALFPALFILTLIFAPITAQMAMYWEFRPLTHGDTRIMQLTLAENAWELRDRTRIETPSGVRISPPHRDPHTRQLTYSLEITPETAPGAHRLIIHAGDRTIDKLLAVAAPGDDALMYVSPMRPPAGWSDFIDQFLYPGEPALSADSPIQRIAILEYPSRETLFLGMRWHWLITSLLWMFIGAFALLPFVKVRF